MVVYCKNVFIFFLAFICVCQNVKLFTVRLIPPVFSSQRSAQTVSRLNKLIFGKDYKRVGQPFHDFPWPVITCADHPQLQRYLENSIIKPGRNKTKPVLISANPKALSRLISYNNKKRDSLFSSLIWHQSFPSMQRANQKRAIFCIRMNGQKPVCCVTARRVVFEG